MTAPSAGPLPSGPNRDRGRPGTLAPRPAAGTHPSGPAGRRPTPPSPAAARPGAPPASRLTELVAGFAQLYLEVECGRRPPRMARRLLDPRLAAQLEGRWVRRGGPPGHLVRVTVVRTSADVVDAVAVVRRGARSGAIAIRLARRHGRWLVTDAVRPEDGPPPALAFTFPPDDVDPLEDLLDAAAARPLEAPAVPPPLEVVA
jgi:hypothetical protein